MKLFSSKIFRSCIVFYTFLTPFLRYFWKFFQPFGKHHDLNFFAPPSTRNNVTPLVYHFIKRHINSNIYMILTLMMIFSLREYTLEFDHFCGIPTIRRMLPVSILLFQRSKDSVAFFIFTTNIKNSLLSCWCINIYLLIK